MAEHRIRRWFQFGVLDLLLLIAIVAVGASLWRSPQTTTYYELLAEGAKPGQHWAGNGLGMKFRWCPPGDFKMGSPVREQVDVKLTGGFWLGKYEVTQGEYRQVMNDNPSAFPHSLAEPPAKVDEERLPVEMVSWDNAVEFCHALTEQERKAGRLPSGWEYRLPTEAQWEYACRAGTQTAYSSGDDKSLLAGFAWYEDNASERTHEVGQKRPNPWGLHDMHGNVWEWCRDAYRDPEVTERASSRVCRGGGWQNLANYCRSAERYGYTPDNPTGFLGFRVALVQSPAEPSERGEAK